MTDLQEKAMRMALEALKKSHPISNSNEDLYAHSEAGSELYNELKKAKALEPPEQEPVGFVTDSGASAYFLKGVDLDDDTPLYAAPPHYWGNVTSAELVEELRRRDMLMVPVKEQEPDEFCTATTEELMKTLGCSDEKAKEIHDKVEALAQEEKREWVGLTDEEIGIAFDKHFDRYAERNEAWPLYERELEAKLKEKNK
jgi:hypothetical protein